MILENQQEKEAFDYICQLASELTNQNKSDDSNIINWLKTKTRMREDHEKWSLTQ